MTKDILKLTRQIHDSAHKLIEPSDPRDMVEIEIVQTIINYQTGERKKYKFGGAFEHHFAEI